MVQDEVELEAGGSMQQDAADEPEAAEAYAEADAAEVTSPQDAADEPAAAGDDDAGYQEGPGETAAASGDGDGATQAEGQPQARADEDAYLDDPEGQAEAAAQAGDSEDEEGEEEEAKPEKGEEDEEAEDGGGFSYGAAADAASVAAAGGEEEEEEEEQEEEQEHQDEDEGEEGEQEEQVAAADDQGGEGEGAGAAGEEETEAEADLGAPGGGRAGSNASSSSSLPPIASPRSHSHTAAAAQGAAAPGQHLPAAASAAAPAPAPAPANQPAAATAKPAAARQPSATDGRGAGGGGSGTSTAAPRKAAVPTANANQSRSPTRQSPASRGPASQTQPRASQSPARKAKPAAASSASSSSPPMRLRPNPSPPPRHAGTKTAPAGKSAAGSRQQQQQPVPRLRDALAAETPDAESITQQYLRLLQAGALNKNSQQQQRPSTAPDAAEDASGKGSGGPAAGAISAPGTAASAGRGGKAQAQPQARPVSGGSGGSGGSGQQPGVHTAELARLQARSAWADNVTPISRKTTPSSTTHADGLGATSPRGGASGSAHLPPLHLAHASSAPGSRSGSPRSRSFRALRQDVPSKVFSPRPSTSAAPYTKLYTPGPGAYDPVATRHGDASWLGGGTGGSLGSAGGGTGGPGPGGFGFGTGGGWGSGRGLSGSPPKSWSFGGAAARPPHVCIQHVVDSPGPVYLPSKEGLSTLSSTGTYKFDRQLPGARFSLTAGVPPNAPLHNPGPGTYDPVVTPAGDPVSPSPVPPPAGGGAPAHAFPRARKGLTAASNPAALPIISKEQAAHEYLGTHSPGPAAYSPEVSPTRPSPPSYSSPGRPARSWVDPEERSPGPVYKPADMDRTGRHTLGDCPQAVIGTGPKGYDPVGALSASPWISLDAARRVNYGIHSPGPGTYHPPLNPRLVAGNVAVPALGAGPPDRFAGRSEPGRLQ